MSHQDYSAMTESRPDPGMPLHAALAAAAFTCVMLAGAWQIIQAARHIEIRDVPHAWLDFREGRMTGTLEKQLDQKLPARATLIAAANTVRYVLTRAGGEQVRVGKDGWLFLTDELRFHNAASSQLTARADLLAAASTALERDGVALVIALVPDKARVYPDRLHEGHFPAYNAARYQDALSALKARGVHVVDLLNPLTLAAARSEVYYRSDTHWSQTGAQAAAQAIAAEVHRLNADLSPATFVTEKSGIESERPGDLIRLMGLENVPNALRPRPDRETPLLTRQTSAEGSGGLFDDAAVPVVLTGTSYSLRGNFHGFLQQALGTRVLNAAKDGAGFLQATTQYLLDEAFRSSKPKVLVWEVPERFLGEQLAEEGKWLQTVGLGR